MLVLTRNRGERVVIHVGAVQVVVQVCQVKEGGQVRLGFEAPAYVKILREELEPKEAT